MNSEITAVYLGGSPQLDASTLPYALCPSGQWLYLLSMLVENISSELTLVIPAGVKLEDSFAEDYQANYIEQALVLHGSGLYDLPVNFHDERNWPIASHAFVLQQLRTYGQPGLELSRGVFNTRQLSLALNWCKRTKADQWFPQYGYEVCSFLVFCIIWTRLGNVYCLNKPLVKIESSLRPPIEVLDEVRRRFTHLYLGQMHG